MKNLPLYTATVLISAITVIGCDKDSSHSTNTTPPTDSQTARGVDNRIANPINTGSPGINPTSATGAAPNFGATATSTNPAPSAATASHTPDTARGSTAVGNSGAPGDLSSNTGTSPNPHRIEDNAQPAAAQTGMSAEQFVQQAASGGLFEVQSSQLALKKTSNQSVKDFAQRMINDHQKANDQLKQIAHGESLTIPDRLLPKHQQLLDQLNNSSGDFDKQYDQIQKQAHEETVALFQNASRDLSDPQLKNFATQTLPTLQQHLAHVNQLPQ